MLTKEKTNYYVNWKYSEEGTQFLQDHVIDKEKILEINDLQGVYLISAEKGKEKLAMYIGESGSIPYEVKPYVATNCSWRLLQHLKGWSRYTEHYTGLSQKDFHDGWRINVEMIEEAPDYCERKEKELYWIEKLKPYLQNSVNGLFQKYNSPHYNRGDLCIHPFDHQRRKAFLYALNKLREESTDKFN